MLDETKRSAKCFLKFVFCADFYSAFFLILIVAMGKGLRGGAGLVSLWGAVIVEDGFGCEV